MSAWEAQLLSRIEQLEARVEALEQVKYGTDIMELVEKACTCGVGAKPGGLHSVDCVLSQHMNAIALRAGS